VKYSPYLKSCRKKLSGFAKKKKNRFEKESEFEDEICGDGLRACVYFLHRMPLSMCNMRIRNAKEDDYHARLSMVFHTDSEYKYFS
jgi:hypothetical protein